MLLEISCHGIPWFIIALVGIFINSHPNDRVVYIKLLIGLLTDLAFVGGVKCIVQRSRPSENRPDMFATISVNNFSFPSGHTTRAVFLMMFGLNTGLGFVMCCLLVKWAIIVACSRVLLGRHHILDVLAGVIIGISNYSVLIILLDVLNIK